MERPLRFFHEVRGCSLAVDIVARELKIPLDLQWVNMTTKRLPDGSDYLAVNSKGTVPTLQLPDGQFLSEGAVIMQYLADQRPESALLAPPGTIKRYRILEWMSFIAADLHKGGFMPLFKKITPPECKAIARQYVMVRMKWLNDQLAGTKFLCGCLYDRRCALLHHSDVDTCARHRHWGVAAPRSLSPSGGFAAQCRSRRTGGGGAG